MSGANPNPNVEEGMKSNFTTHINLKKVRSKKYEMFDHISQLPDCILSYILTKLSIKDLLKTRLLSKRWCNSNLWASKIDILYFDIFNVLENTEQELLQKGFLIDIPSRHSSIIERSINLEISLDQFVRRVDQFLKYSPATTIHSFLLNFYLNSQQQTTIDNWITFVIKRGIRKMDLLFDGRPYNLRDLPRKYYKFSFNLFLETNDSTLKQLRLEYCNVSIPPNWNCTPFKNLSFLSLKRVKVNGVFVESLTQLEELHLIQCELKSSILKIKIGSSSLCHLKVKSCYVVFGNSMKFIEQCSLDCLKLTSFEYDGHHDSANLNFNTPMLKNLQLVVTNNEQHQKAFGLFATLPKLQILQLDILSMVPTSLKITQPLKNLKQLNFTIFCLFDLILDTHVEKEFGLLGILTILQACPLLQKLSVMLTYPEISENQKVARDVEAFSHDEVKVIELRGCVGNWYEIEFAMNVIKYANKLERIILNPYWRDIDSLDWRSDIAWFHSGRQRITEKFQSEEVVGREKLVLI